MSAKFKPNAAPVPPVDDLSSKSINALKALVLELRDQNENLVKERIKATIDRDAVEKFLTITKQEVRDCELNLIERERLIDGMRDHHRSEVKSYQKKIQHLEFQQSTSIKEVEISQYRTLEREDNRQLVKENNSFTQRQGLRSKIEDAGNSNIDSIQQLRAMHETNIRKLQSEFRTTLAALEEKFEGRVEALKAELVLRHKVEVHEVEERRNLHINQLMRSHEEAFAEIKKYYNDITKANLALISTLKSQIAEANRKQTSNQLMMKEISDQNKKISDPLQRAIAELHSLQADLRDVDKDKQSLSYAIARMKSLRTRIQNLRLQHSDLESQFVTAEKERDALYARFEETITAVKNRSDQRGAELERRLGAAEANLAEREAQVTQVVKAGELDPAAVEMMKAKVDEDILVRDQVARELRAKIAILSKAHNDAVRTFRAHAQKLGVPEEDIRGLPIDLLPSSLTTGPAGLVAK